MSQPAKILVLYYSMYGHIERMAEAVAEGARAASNAEVTIKRVPELVPEEVLASAGAKTGQAAPIATPDELPEYDAIIIGTPTRFGNMAAQMRNFWDQTGKLWFEGRLLGKVGSAFTSTAVGGGMESTILSTHTNFLHHGMVVVGTPYAKMPEAFDIAETRGGGPYGAGTFAGTDGSRMPSENELSIARQQGAHVARITTRLAA